MQRLGFLLFALTLLFSTSAFADDHYYYIFTGVIKGSADGVHYPTPDAACQVDYKIMEASLASDGYTLPAPYTSPTLYYSAPPNTAVYACNATATFPATDIINAQTTTIGDSIQQQGDNCTNGHPFNPQTGLCEDPTQDQNHNELGDSDSPQATGGVLICKAVGDPINASMGNVFESETDYQDSDGELRFTRYYNSTTGWSHSYQTYLMVSSTALQLEFEDGHSSLFKLDNGVATPQPTELGSLTQVNGQWVYTSPANEQFAFDASGRLVTWRQANGLTQTLTYVTASGAYTPTTITVTDSRGHTLSWNNSNYGLLTQLTAGDLTVAYTWVTTPSYVYQLTQVGSMRAGHTGTRTYTYGDTRNPRWLTSLTDERGVQYASWAYDAQGRGTSSQHAGGADATTVTYNSDGTSTVSNALSHNVTYTYQVIQGVNRITHIAGEPAASCPASNSSYTYTANGQVQTMTDALGHVTAYTYDTQGREITRVEAQGTPQARTISTQWDTTWPYLRDSVTTVDHITTYSYDSQGRLLSTTMHDTKE